MEMHPLLLSLNNFIPVNLKYTLQIYISYNYLLNHVGSTHIVRGYMVVANVITMT